MIRLELRMKCDNQLFLIIAICSTKYSISAYLNHRKVTHFVTKAGFKHSDLHS